MLDGDAYGYVCLCELRVGFIRFTRCAHFRRFECEFRNIFPLIFLYRLSSISCACVYGCMGVCVKRSCMHMKRNTASHFRIEMQCDKHRPFGVLARSKFEIDCDCVICECVCISTRHIHTVSHRDKNVHSYALAGCFITIVIKEIVRLERHFGKYIRNSFRVFFFQVKF